MLRIGFFGTGIMGKPMSVNLLRAGVDVTVFNRTASKMEEPAKAGAKKASNPAEPPRGADIVITIALNTP